MAALVAVLLTAPTAVSAEQDDWTTKLEGMLVFAEEYETALRIWQRCTKAFTEAYYGRARDRSFLDTVEDWARAKRDGNESLADLNHALIVGDIKSALDVHSEMKRRQIADRDRHVFSRELAEDCRAEGIRELARQ